MNGPRDLSLRERLYITAQTRQDELARETEAWFDEAVRNAMEMVHRSAAAGQFKCTISTYLFGTSPKDNLTTAQLERVMMRLQSEGLTATADTPSRYIVSWDIK